MEQQRYHQTIASQLAIKETQVAATAALLADGATVPFIARYRKEVTGELDETKIAAIRDQLERLTELNRRRQAMLESLTERQLLTDELAAALGKADNLVQLEDIYLPHRPKRRTRAMIAQEKGLEPLARVILAQTGKPLAAAGYVNAERGVADVEEALAGARDLIAEWISEDGKSRHGLRELFTRKAVLRSQVVKKNEASGAKFRDYFDWQEPAAKAAGHRLLAMLRGEQEKVLRLSLRPDEEEALALLRRVYIKSSGEAAGQVELALVDGYKRLLAPALENELRQQLKEKADQEAIAVFADNLRQLLLAPPLGQKRILALDPGFRTGAKLVCLDGQGRLLHTATIYPTHGGKQREAAGQTVRDLCSRHRIEAIAVGNGTAGRETETFVRELGLPAEVLVTMVDESGASVYSASETARAEFPDHDLTVRGAVSIGRRLQDPLAELVKIDPKAIGVGQYQHDVDQAALRKALEDVVVSCVNAVGVELNTASLELLSAVSGLGPALARNIIAHRNEHGPFKGRRQMLDVPRLGAKAYEQCAGFLRIHGAANVLDSSAVHPERYGLVERMASDAGCTVAELMTSPDLRQQIDLALYLGPGLGLPTLTDIMAELAKPGRDPRPPFSRFAFAAGVHAIEDLKPGMVLPGIVTNVTKFGAFVDVGVHQDGLVHISQLADRFVKDPAEVARVRQQVEVRVLEVDLARRRIALSMRRG